MDKKLKQLVAKSKVVIFDFDNTMASTEKYSWQAYDAILKQYGKQLTAEHINTYIGNPDKVIIPKMEQDFAIELPYEQTFEQKVQNHLLFALQDNVQPHKFVVELFEHFPNKDYFIMSSNTITIISAILQKWNMAQNFKNIYTYAENQISKKERLQNSLQHFGALNKDIIIFEDSASVINMAKDLGLTCVFIQTSMNKDQQCNFDHKIVVED